MSAPDKIQMTVAIAGEHIRLNVAFEEQNRVRDNERAIARLYDSWRARFPKKSDMEILAMVAYQYASFYADLAARQDSAIDIIEDCIAMLDGDDKPSTD